MPGVSCSSSRSPVAVTPDAAPGSLRYGSDVVVDSQGRALVAGIN